MFVSSKLGSEQGIYFAVVIEAEEDKLFDGLVHLSS